MALALIKSFWRQGALGFVAKVANTKMTFGLGDDGSTVTATDIEMYGSASTTKAFLDASADQLSLDGIALQVSAMFTEKMAQTALIGTATVTAAQLLTKVLDGTPTAAATYTLPTAALLVAAVANAKVGDSFIFVVNNKSAGANTITIAGGAGGTADGTLTVAQDVIRAFLVIITNVTAAAEAYFVYGLG